MASGTTANIPQQGVNAAPASAQQRARPFCQASKWGVEQANAVTFTQGASQQTFGPSPLPATGYIRRVRLPTVGSGGSGGTFTAGGDAPFNVWNLVRFAEPNAAPVVELGGWQLLLADI